MIQMVPNGTQMDEARKIPGLACYDLHEVCCTDMIHISLRDSDRGVKNILQLPPSVVDPLMSSSEIPSRSDER